MRLLFAVFFILSLLSCTKSKEVYYLNGIGNQKSASSSSDLNNPTIQLGDQLSIFVSSANPEQAAYFNMSNFSAIQLNSIQQMQSANPMLGYMVEENGKINFPKIGEISVVGMKRLELQELIEKMLVDYIKDPVVTVRCINYRVTILGEVAKPGTYHVPYHNLNIFQALGLAGDLTINGVRNEIILIRRASGGEQSILIDLTSKDLLTSPYYYIQSGDVIYIKPNKTKINTSSTFFQVWPTVVSAITLLVLVVTNIK